MVVTHVLAPASEDVRKGSDDEGDMVFNMCT